jgi:hypothetical protein
MSPWRSLGGLGSLVKWAERGMTNYPLDLSKRPNPLKIPKGGFTETLQDKWRYKGNR